MQLTKNALYLFAARFINSLAILGLILLISRRLGPDVFGTYSFLNAVVMTGIVIANFGLDTLMVRDVSRDNTMGKKYLTSILAFKLVSSILVISGLYVFFKLFIHDQSTINLLAIFSITICLNALSQSFWYYGDAFQKFQLHAGLWAFSNLLKLPVVWIFISFSENFYMVIYALVLTEIISLVFSGLWIRYYFGAFINSLSMKFVLQLLKKAWPFAIIFILSALYFRIDMIMLEIMKGDTAVGIYSAAYKLVEFLSIIPGTICVVALPGLSNDYSKDLDGFRLKSFKTFLLLGVAGFVVGLFLYLFSNPIISLLYGPLFHESGHCLRILSASVFFLFINGYLIYVAIAMNYDRIVALVLVVSTVSNILLNYYFIPRYSYIGAALTTLISEVLMLLLCLILFKKTNIILWQRLPRYRGVEN